MTRYRVTVDKTACDGIFACLVRDDRLVESAEGLATFDPDSALELTEDGTAVSAVFEDEKLEKAEGAAAACPPGAITVEEECP